MKSQMLQNLQINEIINLLNNFNSSAIDDLSNKFPQFTDYLKPGIIAGENSINEQKKISFEIEVAERGLETIILILKEKLPLMKKKLEQSYKLDFYSKIIVIISSASILSLLETQYGKPIAYLASSLSLLSSIFIIFSKEKIKTLNSEKYSFTEIYEKLTKYKIEAENILKQLKILKQTHEYKEINNIINITNFISSEIQLFLAFI